MISEAGHEGKVYELAGDSAGVAVSASQSNKRQTGYLSNLSEADFAADYASDCPTDMDMLADSDVGHQATV